jgi:hypothetical protein
LDSSAPYSKNRGLCRMFFSKVRSATLRCEMARYSSAYSRSPEGASAPPLRQDPRIDLIRLYLRICSAIIRVFNGCATIAVWNTAAYARVDYLVSREQNPYGEI